MFVFCFDVGTLKLTVINLLELKIYVTTCETRVLKFSTACKMTMDKSKKRKSF